MAKTKRTFRKINKRNKKNNKSKRRVSKRSSRKTRRGGNHPIGKLPKQEELFGINSTITLNLESFVLNEGIENKGLLGSNGRNEYYKITVTPLHNDPNIKLLDLKIEAAGYSSVDTAVNNYNDLITEKKITLILKVIENDYYIFKYDDKTRYKISKTNYELLKKYGRIEIVKSPTLPKNAGITKKMMDELAAMSDDEDYGGQLRGTVGS
jgi:hypothetical protein